MTTVPSYPATQARSGLILFAPSPEASEWRRLIEREAQAAAITTFAAGFEKCDRTGPVVYLSDDLNDLNSASYDEIAIILTQAETLGSWTGVDRVQASLSLSALPATGDALRYITPSTLAGAQRIDVLSFLSVDLNQRTPPGDNVQPDQALSIYREGPPRPGVNYLWQPGNFVIDLKHRISSSGDAYIDLTGRARCIVHGPYVALPAGRWRAVVRFAVDEAASRHRLRFEWGGQDHFTSFEAVAGRPGHFQAELSHTIAQSSLSELRLILPESSLAGTLTFEGVDIELSDLPVAERGG